MPTGIDFSFSRVPAAVAKAAGHSFGVSYLTDLDTAHKAKAWTPAEIAAYRAAGLGVVAVWQGGGSDRTTAWRGGYDRGRRDALRAATQATALGRPPGRPVYFAVDADATSADLALISRYFDGVLSVFDAANVGVYGGRRTIEWAMSSGRVSWFWQTGAWSGGVKVPGIHLYQRIPSTKLGGYDIDIDDAMQPDYGAWFNGPADSGGGGAAVADMWVPGATRKPLGDTAPMNGGGKKVVWHITSNPGGNLKLANELGWFTGGGSGAAPHILYSPITGEMVQMYPANSRSKSVVARNREGTYVIQVEIVFTTEKTDYRSLLDSRLTWKNFGTLLNWLRQLGIPDVWPVGRPSAFARQTASATQWGRSGHFGHNQIPDNDHVDPGPFPDIFTRFPAGSTSPQQEDEMTPDERRAVVAEVTAAVVAALPPALLDQEMPPYTWGPANPDGTPGYRPSIGECIGGSRFANSMLEGVGRQLTALDGKVGAPVPVQVQVDAAALVAAMKADPEFMQLMAKADADETHKRMES